MNPGHRSSIYFEISGLTALFHSPLPRKVKLEPMLRLYTCIGRKHGAVWYLTAYPPTLNPYKPYTRIYVQPRGSNVPERKDQESSHFFFHAGIQWRTTVSIDDSNVRKYTFVDEDLANAFIEDGVALAVAPRAMPDEALRLGEAPFKNLRDWDTIDENSFLRALSSAFEMVLISGHDAAQVRGMSSSEDLYRRFLDCLAVSERLIAENSWFREHESEMEWNELECSLRRRRSRSDKNE